MLYYNIYMYTHTHIYICIHTHTHTHTHTHIYIYLFAVPLGLQDLSSPARDWPEPWKHQVLTAGLPENAHHIIFFLWNLSFIRLFEVDTIIFILGGEKKSVFLFKHLMTRNLVAFRDEEFL